MTTDRTTDRTSEKMTEKMTDRKASEAAQELILSRNPHKAMQEMMDTINELRAVYKEESEALENADIGHFLRVQEKKIRVTTDYHHGARQIIARKDEFRTATPELRAHLIAAQESFHQVAAANLSGLERMRRSVQRLSERIMSIAREAARNHTPNYGASGTLNRNERAVSIGLNESA